MESRDNWDQKQVLQDPEMLARLERNLRGAGMKRRNFLAMASAAAGTAALAACGGSSSPTATTAATTAPTKAPAAASAAAPTTAAAASGAAPTTAASSAAVATKAPVASSAASTAAPASTTVASSAAAGSPAAATGPESTKVFIDGANITSEPVDNDFNRDLYCGGVAQHMSGLLQYDPDFNLVPDLAESYTNSGPVFTFKIRKGATWSDGQPIKAGDFVYSLRRQMDPRTGNGYGSFWDSVIKGASDLSSAKADAANLDQLVAAVGVKAIDDSTLEITGDTFAGLIPNQAAYTASVVAREDIVKKYADAKGVSPWTDPGKTGGPVLASGAYQITAWKHNQQIDLVRNDKYWNAKAIRQKYVTSVIIPDVTKSTLPFENGDVDYQLLPSTEVDRFKASATLKSQTFQYVYPGTRFLVPDTGHAPFDKIEVRKAALLSIDKDRLVNQVGRKIHTVAYAFTAPGVFGFFDDDDNALKNLQKFDKTAAMAALKGTTFEGGRNWPKVTLSYNTSDLDIPTGYPDEIARQLKDSINMDVALEPLDAKVWNARRFALDLQFLLYRWYQDYPDPHNNYYQTFSIHNKGSARQSWTDATYDDLTKKAAGETDKTKRLDLYHQAETRMQTQFAYMPIHWRTDNIAIKPYVQNFPKNKQGYLVYNTNIFGRLWDKVYVTPDSKHDPAK
ncbi:MAG: peptide ABC transporter substrate-binding protein [Thermomicrobiales bacterium]